MGDSISEGTLKSFNKKVGDFVKTDEEVAVVETDKVDVPINSAFAGKISKLLVAEEASVLVGQDLIEIDADAKDSKPSEASPPQKESPKSTPEPEKTKIPAASAKSDGKIESVKIPSLADSISEGILKEWLKKPGESVFQDEQLTSVETDKVDVPINSPFTGTLLNVLAESESKVVVGQNIAEIQLGNVEKPAKSSPGPPKPQPAAVQEPKQQMSKESPKKNQTQSKPAALQPNKVQSGSRSENRVKMTRMRIKIGERLKESQNTAASLTTFNEVDMTNLMQFRKNHKDAVLNKYNVKLGFMSAFLRASALAMEDVPQVNAVIEKEEIVYRDYVDISFAVATPKGLVTPVIRNCESKTMIEIEQEVAALGEKAKKNQITLEDLAGGSFTVSNGGVFGSLYGTPIINLPQSAILGMHAIKERAVVINGKAVLTHVD